MRFIIEQESILEKLLDGLWMTLVGIFLLVFFGMFLYLRGRFGNGEMRATMRVALSTTVALLAAFLAFVPSFIEPSFSASQMKGFSNAVKSAYGISVSENQALSLLNVSSGNPNDDLASIYRNQWTAGVLTGSETEIGGRTVIAKFYGQQGTDPLIKLYDVSGGTLRELPLVR